jgi:hypothetical protein
VAFPSTCVFIDAVPSIYEGDVTSIRIEQKVRQGAGVRRLARQGNGISRKCSACDGYSDARKKLERRVCHDADGILHGCALDVGRQHLHRVPDPLARTEQRGRVPVKALLTDDGRANHSRHEPENRDNRDQLYEPQAPPRSTTIHGHETVSE